MIFIIELIFLLKLLLSEKFSSAYIFVGCVVWCVFYDTIPV